MDYIIVQAGGRGSRLGYLTENKPKALVPVKNLPILFHLFRKYPEKKFLIIADYKKEVLYEYLAAFADVKYQIVETEGMGTCAGIRQAAELIPEKEAFMLIWSDLILGEGFQLPDEYRGTCKPKKDYIGISETFPCRWSYQEGSFLEKQLAKRGVAGLFLFTDKEKLKDIPADGEFVRWLQKQEMQYEEFSLANTKEFGLLDEYQKLEKERCRPFNRMKRAENTIIKESIDSHGKLLAERECAWYKKVREKNLSMIPKLYGTEPLTMEYIRGKAIYQYNFNEKEKLQVLEILVEALQKLHRSEQVGADSFSMKEAYFHKTMKRLAQIEDLVPFARERTIKINGKNCRNVYYYKRKLEKKLEQLRADTFCLIHGDCTFSNMMLREDKSPVLIDPRGYFGYTELFGDLRYDWAKMYYSIVGNYDRFNLKDFRLQFLEDQIVLEIGSNRWESLERDFFAMTNADPEEIKLLHAVIWLSLTTYAWQDYDSVCGAFYNGLFYLEDVL